MFVCLFVWRSLLFLLFSSATNSVWRPGGGGGGGGDVEEFFSIYETLTPPSLFSLYRFVKRFVQICSFCCCCCVNIVNVMLFKEREREREHSFGFWKAGKFSEEEEEEQVQRNIDRCARKKLI